MLHVASESEGGVLTRSDFRSITDIDAEAVTSGSGEDRFLVAPWASAPSTGASEDQGTGHAICAVDARGLFVALSYRRVMNGLPIEELELEAPLCASPVLRGKTRVAPGEPLPAPAPIAIRVDSSGAPVEVLAAPAAAEPTPETLASPRLRIQWDPVARRAEVAKATAK
jgi:gamma-glutamyltranspeptidase/glutathione hydrolase